MNDDPRQQKQVLKRIVEGDGRTRDVEVKLIYFSKAMEDFWPRFERQKWGLAVMMDEDTQAKAGVL